jgi:hypothetical protein
MEKSKRVLSLFLVLTMMLALCVSASASKVGSPITKTKSTDYGTLKGEVWMYCQDAANGTRIGWEPTVRTSISSSYTMAETTVEVECQYTDTGTYPANNWCASDVCTNQNWAEVDMYFTGDAGRDITVHSAHGITYSKSYALYMTNNFDGSFL